jgi:hypothetical protein
MIHARVNLSARSAVVRRQEKLGQEGKSYEDASDQILFGAL